MIDREKLKHLASETQLVLLARIKMLSEVAGLLDEIKFFADGNESDDFLKHFIKAQMSYRQGLDNLEAERIDEENKLWIKMLHTDQQEEEES